MPISSKKPQETQTGSVPPTGRKFDIGTLLVRAKLGMRLAKGWIFRGGASRRLTHSVGERDSCEVRKLFGGHDVKK